MDSGGNSGSSRAFRSRRWREGVFFSVCVHSVCVHARYTTVLQGGVRGTIEFLKNEPSYFARVGYVSFSIS